MLVSMAATALAMAAVQEQSERQVSQALAKFARGMKPRTYGPVEILGATADGLTLVVHVKAAAGTATAEFREEIVSRRWQQPYCNSLETRNAMVRNGVIIRMSWTQDGETAPVTSDATADTCAEAELSARARDAGAAEGLSFFEFKGVRSGDRAASHIDLWGSSVPSVPPCQVGQSLGTQWTHCSFAERTLSGMRMNASAQFTVNGTLRRLSGSVQDASFAVIREAFTLKYGSPVGSGGVWREVWKFADGELVLERKSARSDLEFEFTTYEHMQYIAAYLEAVKPKPKVDF